MTDLKHIVLLVLDTRVVIHFAKIKVYLYQGLDLQQYYNKVFTSEC